MSLETLKLELKDLEILYEKSRNIATRAELADKISNKKLEIKNYNKPILDKNIIPSRDVSPRMDHENDDTNKGILTLDNDSFKIQLYWII